VLAPCFIFGWGPFPVLGLTGAAVATTLGRGTGLLYQIWYLTSRHSRIQVRLRHLKLTVADLKFIMSMATYGMAQQLITTTSWIGLYKILALFGSASLAGYTIAMRIVTCVMLPASGLANAGATLVGQNLGAGRPARAEEAIYIATRFNLILLGIVGALLLTLARPIVAFFSAEPEVIDEGVAALRIISVALPLYGVGMCMGAAFKGAGDMRTPTRLNVFCFWIGQVPLAWILSQSVGLGSMGIFIAVTLSFSALAIWSSLLFRKGRWKQQAI
jgi:putative MATE family efflux protein